VSWDVEEEDNTGHSSPNPYEDAYCQDVAGKPWMAAIQGATLVRDGHLLYD
jgi:hypothetical protein